MHQFYNDTLLKLRERGLLSTDDSVLVLAGGKNDQEALEAAGIKTAVISNLDTRLKGNEFEPYGWSFQDAEKTDYPEGAFDFCLIHNGLHHCYSPHRAILEMYRVARKGIILLEPYDSLLTRIGVKLKIGQDYEIAPVVGHNYQYGGVANSNVPNFVYRLSRHELEKTINCGAPYGEHIFHYFHEMVLPLGRLKDKRNRLPYYFFLALTPLLKLWSLIFPQHMNFFAAAILKPKSLHPWLLPNPDGGLPLPNREYMDRLYKR